MISRETEKVLKFDLQVLFGKSLKQAEVVRELLPLPIYVPEVKTEEATPEGTLSTMEDWLKGLTQ